MSRSLLGRDAPSRPPGPPGRFLSGNLQDYEADRLGFLMHTRADFGGIVRFDAHTTLVHDPALVAEVLAGREGSFRITQNFLTETIDEAEQGVALTVRRLLNPGLRRTVTEPFALEVVQVVDEVLGARVDRSGDATSLLEQITSRLVTRYYLGTDHPGVTAAATALLDALAAVVGNPFALPATLPTPSRRRIRRQLAVLEAELGPHVAERLRHPDSHHDFVTTVLAAPRARPGDDVARITRTLIGAMLAGHRVPAAAAAWLLMLTRGDTDLWAGLAAEGRTMRHASADEEGPRASYPLATAAVTESLRLYPATWLLNRQAGGPVALGGYAFPAGHQFLISPYVVHRDPAAFAEPEDFRPERWRDAGSREMRASYLPFGSGSRRCPGQHLAFTMLRTVVLAVASGWEIHRVDDGRVRADPRTTLIPGGLRFRIHADRRRLAPY